MADELLQLAMGIHENPGAYALLLGSGVSSSAGVPTGWGIVEELCRRLAVMEGQEEPENPAEWYGRTYGGEPDYGEMLERLAPEPAERMAILRGFIEPSGDDRSRGLRVPTAAHMNIARLVSRRFVRVIVTTNFDRLIEEALAAEGVQATVISSDDDIKGAVPLVHSACTVVKLHGDYLDTRIRNTGDELGEYTPGLQQLLQEIIRDFGLVVVGWSAQWDTALRATLLGSPRGTYSSFLCTRCDLTAEAAEIERARGMRVIRIARADDFFSALEDSLGSLSRLAGNTSLSTATLVESVKRYLGDEREENRLRDLILKETERTRKAMSEEHFVGMGSTDLEAEFVNRLTRYEDRVERLLRLLGTIGYYGNDRHTDRLPSAIQRIAGVQHAAGSRILLGLQFYPATLLTYCVGIASLARGNYGALGAVLAGTYREPLNGEPRSLVETASPVFAFREGSYRLVPRPSEGEHTPTSNRIYETLWPILEQYIPDERDYSDLFDVFEYIVALAAVDTLNMARPVIGRFGWRDSRDWPNIAPVRFLTKEGVAQALLRAGLFGGATRRLAEASEKLNPWVQETRAKWT